MLLTSMFREMAKGYTNLETFCGIMNMPPAANANAFNKIKSKVLDAYNATNESMVLQPMN